MRDRARDSLVHGDNNGRELITLGNSCVPTRSTVTPAWVEVSGGKQPSE